MLAEAPADGGKCSIEKDLKLVPVIASSGFEWTSDSHHIGWTSNDPGATITLEVRQPTMTGA